MRINRHSAIALCTMITLLFSLVILWLNRDVFYCSTQLKVSVKAYNASNIILSYGPLGQETTVSEPAKYAFKYTKHSISIRNLYQKNSRSLATEVWLFRVLLDGKPVSWNQFKIRGQWDSRPDGRGTGGRVLVSFRPGTQSELDLTTVFGNRLDIVLLKHPWSAKAEITIDGQSHTVDLYSPTQSLYQFTQLVGTPVYSEYTVNLNPSRLAKVTVSGDNPASVVSVNRIQITNGGSVVPLQSQGNNLMQYKVPNGINRSPFYWWFFAVGVAGIISLLISLSVFLFNCRMSLVSWFARIIGLTRYSSSSSLSTFRDLRLATWVAAAPLAMLLALFIGYYVSKIAHAPFMADDYSNILNFQNWTDVRGKLFRIPQYDRGFMWILILYVLLKTPVWFGHIVNVTVHITNCFLLVYIYVNLCRHRVRLIMRSCLLLLLLVNPYAVESLLWITAGYPIYVLFFTLLACLAMIKHVRERRLSYFVLFILFSACAFFINEQGLITFPLYVYVAVYAGNGELTISSLFHSIKKVVSILAIWIVPYVVYRLILLLEFHSSSAVQTYTQYHAIPLIISVYRQMIWELSKTSVSIVIITGGSILLLMLTMLRHLLKNHQLRPRVYWARYEFALWLVLFILLLLFPFSLLGGWLEHRFFYLSSSFVLVLLFMVKSLVVRDTQAQLRLLGRWNRLFAQAIYFVDIVAVSCVAICSSVNYARDVLQPVNNLSAYVDDFIEWQNRAYKKLPNDSTVFVDIRNPNYPVPRYYAASSSIRLAWVPPALRELNKTNPNVTVLLLNGVVRSNVLANVGVTPYASWFTPQSTLNDLSATRNRKFYLAIYDGTSWGSPTFDQLQFSDANGKQVASFSLDKFYATYPGY